MKYAIVSDLHVRGTIPQSRIDDYFSTQRYKLNQIARFVNEHEAQLIIAGDVGDTYNWPNWLLSEFVRIFNTIEVCPYCIAGQHDLYGNKIENISTSALSLFEEIRILDITNNNYSQIELSHYGCLDKVDHKNGKAILVCHTLTSPTNWPPSAISAIDFIKQHQERKLIIVGDNHKTFFVEYNGTTLLSPGSMMRMSIDQVDHKPCIFLYDLEANALTQHFLNVAPAEKVLQRQEAKDNHNDEVWACVAQLANSKAPTVNFEENLRHHITVNDVAPQVIDKIWESFDK